MKRNRLVVIVVAIAMCMLLVQGALAADEEMGELLRGIEADRSSVVDDLVNSLATDDVTAEQLRATLKALSASKLARIYANADTLDDVRAMLSEDILTLGDFDKDYVYTPVSPCRIIDTREAGGPFSPGTRREFYVYGNTAAQGGANCPSPRGEPRAVHIYIVAVPVAGQGNFGAYPANISPPNAAILNYKTGVQNIGNAATIKTFFQVGREIEFINRNGTADLVVDVLGYYHDAEPEKVVAADSSGTLGSSLTVATGFTTIVSKTVNIRASGRVIIMGEAQWRNSDSDFLICRFTENGTQVDEWFWSAGALETQAGHHQSRFYMKTVSAGPKTYALECRANSLGAHAENRNLTVLFIKEDL